MQRQQTQHWPRAILLVDMNAFFASVEQHDRPEWRGRPVAITNGLQGTCIITSSYEARARGIHTGMRLKRGRQLCPELIQCAARPERYAQVSLNIMQSLREISPEIEIFSVDEAFLDITRSQRLLGSPEQIAILTRQVVHAASGVLCSVGVSGDKTTAKYAAKLQKPDGLTVIPPWQSRQRLQDVPVTELCGINRGIGDFLARHGVYTCGDMAKLPISVLAARFGNPGRRIWHMCQGQDPEPLITDVAAPQSIGHGKVMPPDTRDRNTLILYLLHMSEKVAARLRRHELQASRFYIGFRTEQGWLADVMRSEILLDDSRLIMQLCDRFLQCCWSGQGVHQVQITAQDPQPAHCQPDLFTSDRNATEVNQMMDGINQRYGEFTLTPARLLGRSSMPNVIAPAWKPFGHRETILGPDQVAQRETG